MTASLGFIANLIPWLVMGACAWWAFRRHSAGDAVGTWTLAFVAVAVMLIWFGYGAESSS